MTTTIQIDDEIRNILNDMKLHARETYNDVLERLIEDFQELNAETKKQIEQARKEFAQGKYHTIKEVKSELGL
jgi:predicted CopG family antitoxin